MKNHYLRRANKLTYLPQLWRGRGVSSLARTCLHGHPLDFSKIGEEFLAYMRSSATTLLLTACALS